MNNNNLHKIFANTTCVSTEMMMNYLDGKLSEKEKNTIEVHITSCEMCGDELEGLSLLKDKSKLAIVVADLDEKIDIRIKAGGKKISFFRRPVYKIAAAVIIMIASAWFLRLYVDSSVNTMDESMVSQAMEEKDDLESELIEDSIEEPTIEIEREEIAIEKQKQEKEKVNKTSKIKGPESKTDKTVVETVVLEDFEADLESIEEEIDVNKLSTSTTNEVIIAENKTLAESKLKDEKKVVSKEKVKTEFADDIIETDQTDETVADYSLAEGEKIDRKATRGNNRKNRLFKGRSKKQLGVQSNTVAFDNFDQAMTEYNKRDYIQAITLFKKSLNAHSNADEVHFYLAKSYTQLDDTENALENYNKVIAFAESPYYEDALLNKAQILIELDKRKSAINSLNQLKNRRGVYSKKADKMIDSLNIVSPTIEKDK